MRSNSPYNWLEGSGRSSQKKQAIVENHGQSKKIIEQIQKLEENHKKTTMIMGEIIEHMVSYNLNICLMIT